LEADFDLPVIKVVYKAAKEILNIQGGHHNQGIPKPALIDQLKKMVRIGAVYQTELPALGSLVASIYEITLAPDYFLPMAQEFIQHQRVMVELEKVSSLTLQQLPSKIQAAAASAQVLHNDPYFPLETIMIGQRVITVPTGLAGIDSGMNGGLPLGEYGIICAHTGVGKTMLGINFCWGGANDGFQTRLATLELPAQKCAERLYSNIARVDYDLIRYGNPNRSHADIWNEVIEKVGTNGQGRQRNMQIWDFHKEICTAQTLEDWIHRDQDNHPEHPPQLIFVDWLLCMGERTGVKFNHRNLKTEEKRHKIQNLSEDLSRLAAQEKVGIWAATQGDAKSEGKAKITMANAVEAKSTSWRSYAFIGIGASEEDRMDNIFTANAAKMRDGRIFCCKLVGELYQCRFVDCDESVLADRRNNLSQENVSSDLAAARRNGVILDPIA